MYFVKINIKRISKGSSCDKEDNREMLKWFGHIKFKEKGRRARTKKNVRCTSTRKETERKTGILV